MQIYLKLNNTDEETVIMRTPITIISIDKIINTFIIIFSHHVINEGFKANKKKPS